jgi:hypothetical protein
MWDAAEPGEATSASAARGRDARIIRSSSSSGWTPDSLGGDFPVGSGVLIRPGSRIVVQLAATGVDGVPAPLEGRRGRKVMVGRLRAVL